MRHGETALNVQKVMQGRIDEPLNENGRELARLTGRGMTGIRFDHCISSPLMRAKETAAIILKETGNDIPIELDERIHEISFGIMEGKTLEEMGEEGVRLFRNPFLFSGFPRGERISDVCKRTQAFLKELIARDDGKTYLVSTHGCSLRAMVNYLKEDPSDFWGGHAPYNCSFTIIDSENGEAKIVGWDQVFMDESLVVDHYPMR